MSSETVYLLIPEIVLIGVAVVIYVGGAFVDGRSCWSWIAGGGILAAAIALWMQSGTAVVGGPVTADPLASYARWLALVFAALLVLLASRPLSTPGTPEYVGSLLLAVAGLMLVSGAKELVLLFLGLELISIPTYILLYLGRRDAASQEAALKYFLLSILASAMLLYGLAFLYGSTGSTDIDQIAAAVGSIVADGGGTEVGFGPLVKLALVLVFAGLGFKIAAVPFHFYAPDVYQGTTYANGGLLSVVPKAAGLVALVRIVVGAMPGMESLAWRVAVALAILTMTFGNVMALWQDNLRRLLAYSSVAHAGYLLIGLAVGLASGVTTARWDGLGALLFYLCVYALATIGTFAAIEHLRRRDREIEAIEELAGLGRSRPLVAAVVGVLMFSLAGIPPVAGFWGKLAVFGSALSVDVGPGADGSLRPWFVALAVIGVLNAAVAAAYYLRIVAVMYFRTPLAVPRAEGGRGAWYAALASALLIIVIGLFPGPLLSQSDRASPGPGDRQGLTAETTLAGAAFGDGDDGTARRD